MKKDPRVYLAHILEKIERIEKFTSNGKIEFLGSPMIQDSVIRNFEVIGEAAGRISEDFRKGHPQIPWKKITGMRNVLIHNYEGVDFEQVWLTVEKDLPPLKEAIVNLLPPLDQLEKEIAGE